MGVRWDGLINIASRGLHTFKGTVSSTSDGGMRVWIGGKLIINDNSDLSECCYRWCPGTFFSEYANHLYDITVDGLAKATGVSFTLDLDPGTGTFANVASGNLYQRYDVSGSPFAVTVTD